MKKILLVTMALLMFIPIFPNQNASAEEFTEAEKKQKATRIFKGIGQRLGIAWTADMLLQVVNSAFDDSANGVDYGTSFIGRIPIMDATVNTELNRSEYLLSADDFKNGAKLIQNAANKEIGTYFPTGQLCYPSDLDNVLPGGTYHSFKATHSNGTIYYVYGHFNDAYYVNSRGQVRIDGADIKYSYKDINGVLYGPLNTGYYWSASIPTGYTLTVNYTTKTVRKNGYFLEDYVQKNLCEYTTVSKPSFDSVSPRKIQNLDHYENPTIIYVDESTYYTDPSPIPENTVLPDEDFPDPDSDGDGVPDPQDNYPDDPTNEPIDDKPQGSSWWDWLLSPLIELIKLMKSALDGLVSLVTGLAKAIADAIGAIFVPSDGFFTGFFDEIKLTWDSKIPIIGQLSDFMTTVESTSTDAARPVIEVDLPERYGGVTISVIDFSYFDQYRDWILNFIRFTAWFIFLKRLWARLPRVIGG